MELVGYSFFSKDPPLGRGYLRLGAYSALVGANDVGKSTLLRLIHEELDRVGEPSPDRVYQPGGIFFIEATEAEADLLAWLATSDLRWWAAGSPTTTEELDLWTYGVFPPADRRQAFWHFGAWDTAALDCAAAPPPVDSLAAWSQTLHAHAPQSDGWTDALAQLANSRCFAFAYGGSLASGPMGADRHAWDVFWCLPASARDDPFVVTVIAELEGANASPSLAGVCWTRRGRRWQSRRSGPSLPICWRLVLRIGR